MGLGVTSVSVISPSFNQMDYLEACLGSVAAQQNVDVEHLIFDPGSTDGSREFAAAHAARYPFVQYFGEPDTGQADAINKGLEMASGDILTWLNSDDSYVGPAVLERVVAEFEANPDVDVVCGRGTYITPEGKLIKEAWVHRDGAVIPDRLRKSIGLFQPSVFFRRRVYEKVGGLDTAYDLSLDYDYWIRFAQAGMNFHFLDEVLAKMTIHRDSKTVGSRGAQFDEYLEMLQKHYGRPDPVWIDRAALHRATGRDGMLDSSRQMTFSQAARYRFHHSLLRRRHLPETPRLESAVVATTFDASYYEQGLNLIAGLHRTSMDSVDQIVVFDLGLESEQRDHLSGYDRVTVVDYPSEVDGLFDGYMNPKNYSYKCAAIKAAGEFVDDGGVVVFMDAGITPLRPIREIVERTRTNGVFFVDHGDVQTWPIYNIQFTHENSLAAMGATVEEAIGEHLCSCLIGYTKGGPFQSLINEAYEYSKDPTIVVAPKHLAPGARIEARVGNDARMLRKEILEAPSDHSSIDRDELRALFGYFGHRQDQSIYSVLAARYGAEQEPASRYNASNSQSSRVSKLNWESGSVSTEISVSRTNLDSTDDATVIYHHRGTFSNLDGLQHGSRTSDCLFLLGNGPSLASIDLRSLEGVDSMGFNAAYRHWREIDWYPTYYACLDTVVILSHADEIADMVHSADKNGIRRFFLREKILEARPELENNPLVMFFERESGRRSGLGARPLTTGSHSLLWAWLLGYTRIFMLGVDLNYVEVIDGAKLDADSTLSIESDIDHNPNYFFPGYQTKGDQYNIANPEPNLHYDSWVAAAKTLPGNVDVFNLNPNSAVDIFETMDFETALQEAQVTRRSVFRTFDPPARATGVEGLLLGPFERGEAGFSEADAIHAYLSSVIDQPGVMVDVGAHFGGSLAPFANDGWAVLGFEPDDDNRAELAKRRALEWDLDVDTRAVSYVDDMILPFYQSAESTGVSGLSPFLDSHKEVQRVRTVTLNTFLAERGIEHVHFLKIDTEGHDLDVLEGFPWDRDRPDVVLCEFENRKTEPLGYQTEELAATLHDKGYEVLISEWHPVVRYGVPHDFRALRRWEPGCVHPEAWGNLIAVRGREASDTLVAMSDPFVKRKFQPITESTSSPLESMQGRAVGERPTSASTRSMARRIFDRRNAILRRLARWYASPSGVLFLVALALGLAAVAGVPGARWYGAGALVALAVFVPYKFSREQVRNDRRLDVRARALAQSAGATQRELAEILKATDARIKDLREQVARIGQSADASRTALSAAQRKLAEIHEATDVGIQDLRERIVRLDQDTAARLTRVAENQAARQARLETDLQTERAQRIEGFAGAVDVLASSLFLTGETEDGGYILQKSAPSDAMKDRRLIFTASSGRAGSHYVAQLLGSAENVYATHEAHPYMIGHHLRAVLDRPLDLTYEHRKVKATAIRATLAGLPRNVVYAESNHMFIKTFHDVILNEFDPSGVSVILLRRRLDEVLKSLLELGYFTPDNSDWVHWMHLPHGANLLARPPDPISKMDDIDRAIGYLFDIEARMQRFSVDHPGLNIVPATISNISSIEGAEALLRQVGVKPTEATQAIAGRPTNKRTAAKLHQVDLEECRSRILAYHDRALRAGVFAPDIALLLED